MYNTAKIYTWNAQLADYQRPHQGLRERGGREEGREGGRSRLLAQLLNIDPPAHICRSEGLSFPTAGGNLVGSCIQASRSKDTCSYERLSFSLLQCLHAESRREKKENETVKKCHSL
jgi:hypothetical protein